jgi:hypothetical protein
METMWLVMVEVAARNREQTESSKIGFMNITTWADSKETASIKIKKYLESFDWHLVAIEKASVIDDNAEYGKDVADMIERTRNNPNAIIPRNVSYL